MVWILIGYMWLFIHRPFEIWPWMAAYRPERVYMIFAIVCWLASRPKLPKWNRLHAYFALFVAVVIMSWLMSPYQTMIERKVENYLKLVVFYFLLVTTVRDERDLRKIVVGFVCVMALFMAHSTREWICGREFYAQGFERLRGVGSSFADQNYFAGLIAMSLPFTWVLWRQWSGRLTRGAVLGYFGLSVWCIIRAGSRMGFCGLVAACFLAALASPKRWRILAISPLLLAGGWMLIPEAQQSRYLTIVGEKVEGSHARVDYRAWGFWWGVELCAERPLFGHGPGATQLARGERGQPHNTYGQVLGELGLAGAAAFALTLLGVGQNFFEAWRTVHHGGAMADSFAWHTVAAASAAFLLTAFMGWGLHFLYYHVWLWFGAFQVLGLQCLVAQAQSTQETAECHLAAKGAVPALT
jgi:hypothetical protein